MKHISHECLTPCELVLVYLGVCFHECRHNLWVYESTNIRIECELNYLEDSLFRTEWLLVNTVELFKIAIAKSLLLHFVSRWKWINKQKLFGFSSRQASASVYLKRMSNEKTSKLSRMLASGQQINNVMFPQILRLPLWGIQNNWWLHKELLISASTYQTGPYRQSVWLFTLSALTNFKLCLRYHFIKFVCFITVSVGNLV